jgi:hypothetical protein
VLIEVLVKDQIEGGLAVLDALRAEGFPVVGAFWCRLPDRDYWKLVIASDFVSQFGPLKAYQTVRAILEKQPVASVSPSDILLFSPNDPGYVRLCEYALGPGQFGIGPSQRYNMFQDAYVYGV